MQLKRRHATEQYVCVNSSSFENKFSEITLSGVMHRMPVGSHKLFQYFY